MPRPRKFHTDPDDATMPMPHLRERFINLYRKVYGSNVGLSDAEIMRMNRKELRRNIHSLEMMLDAHEERVERARQAMQAQIDRMSPAEFEAFRRDND